MREKGVNIGHEEGVTMVKEGDGVTMGNEGDEGGGVTMENKRGYRELRQVWL